MKGWEGGVVAVGVEMGWQKGMVGGVMVERAMERVRRGRVKMN